MGYTYDSDKSVNIKYTGAVKMLIESGWKPFMASGETQLIWKKCSK